MQHYRDYDNWPNYFVKAVEFASRVRVLLEPVILVKLIGLLLALTVTELVKLTGPLKLIAPLLVVTLAPN